jgi:hypothetical protein
VASHDSRFSAATVGSLERCRPGLALIAICLGFSIVTLDATMVNVALGPIVHQLG